MVKWEYKVINTWITEDTLNPLGQQGWELVHVTLDPILGRSQAFLKRPIADYGNCTSHQPSTSREARQSIPCALGPGQFGMAT